MKNLIKYLMALSLLFVCMSCSKEEPIEGITQDEIVRTDMSKFLNYLKEIHTSDSSVQKRGGENNRNEPYFVSVYSDYFDDYMIYAAFWIPGTSMSIYSLYPTDGEDRALVNGEWIMESWNLSGPRTFIVDFNDGLIKYSNWCDDVQEGRGLQRARGKLIELDFDGDGLTDVWRLDPYDEESDFTGFIKTTLTDAQIQEPYYFPILGECKELTTRVDLNVKIHIKNGEWIVDVVLDGVKYSNNK